MVTDKEVIARIGHIYRVGSFGDVVIVCPAGSYIKVKLLEKRCQNFISGSNPDWGPGYASITRSCIRDQDSCDDLMNFIKLRLLGR